MHAVAGRYSLRAHTRESALYRRDLFRLPHLPSHGLARDLGVAFEALAPPDKFVFGAIV